MSRIFGRSIVTYPPELLPRAGDDDDAEVVVCDADCGENDWIQALEFLQLALPVEVARQLFKRSALH